MNLCAWVPWLSILYYQGMGQGRLHLVICELIYSVKVSFFALVVRRQERRCIVMEPSVTV
jgi:hypothetical protein